MPPVGEWCWPLTGLLLDERSGSIHVVVNEHEEICWLLDDLVILKQWAGNQG